MPTVYMLGCQNINQSTDLAGKNITQEISRPWHHQAYLDNMTLTWWQDILLMTAQQGKIRTRQSRVQKDTNRNNPRSLVYKTNTCNEIGIKRRDGFTRLRRNTEFLILCRKNPAINTLCGQWETSGNNTNNADHLTILPWHVHRPHPPNTCTIALVLGFIIAVHSVELSLLYRINKYLSWTTD